MAKLVLSDFCSYEFESPHELWQAQILSPQQRQWFQYLLSKAALERINTHFDEANKTLFVQRTAELIGEMNILRHILNESDVALDNLNHPSQEN